MDTTELEYSQIKKNLTEKLFELSSLKKEAENKGLKVEIDFGFTNHLCNAESVRVYKEIN
jgi:hypothetical protein